MVKCPRKCETKNKFYGTTTFGERGQIVIPARARADFKLEKGEQLLVFGLGDNMITLHKIKDVKKIANRLSQKLNSIKSILKKIT